mgnify:FL=1
MKGFDYDREIKSSKLYERMRPLGFLLKDKRYKVEYVGLENIPEEGGFILASNHINMFDPAIIAIGIKNRQLHFMGKKELFDNPIVGCLFKKVNGFPVARGAVDTKALDYAARVVKEGHILGIFPEGTRSKDCKPKSAKRGISVIARAAKADVLPVSIYTDGMLERHSKVTVRFGQVIPFEELGIGGDDCTRQTLTDAARYIMDEIVRLWEEGHCK